MDRATGLISPRFKGVYLAALVSFFCAIAVVFYFRYQIQNGFTVLNGDRYDQVIAISIFEHWRNTLLGISHWSETGYFYPVKGTIGYDDGYFLYGLIYAIFRGFGIDPYLGGELVNVSTRVIGFLGFYLMARRVFALPLIWGLFGATLFTISNNVFVEANHTQLLGVSFVPVMAVLVHELIVSISRYRAASVLIWGIGASAFYAAWLMTTFYMAWYFAFFSVFLFGAYFLIRGREGISVVWSALREQRVSVGIVVAAFVLFNIPFVSVYLPKAIETGMHSFAEVSKHTLSPFDIVNVGDGSLLYGNLIRALDANLPAGTLGDYEQATGIPLALLFCFGCGFFWLWRNRENMVADRNVLLCSVAAATVVTWILTLHLGGMTLWWFIYILFPGAQAARVVARYQIFLTAPVIIVGLSYLAQNASKTAAPVLGLVCGLLVVEQFNTAPVLGLQRPQEVARLASVPHPPSACGAFFVTHARPEGVYPDVDAIYNHNVDAMMVAETMHVPTLNGYATFVPPRWNLVDPEKPDYINRVKAFVTLNPVADLCRLDLRALTWSTKPFS